MEEAIEGIDGREEGEEVDEVTILGLKLRFSTQADLSWSDFNLRALECLEVSHSCSVCAFFAGSCVSVLSGSARGGIKGLRLDLLKHVQRQDP
jgi:hypothetical protein